jgi:fumarate reductase subunit D
MSKPRISHEPIFWAPFSAGGMLSALLIPVHIVLFALAIPLGLIDGPGFASLAELVANPIAQVYIVVLVAGCLFHWAHRFRYVLIDLGLHGGRGAVAFLCYGAAAAGSVWSAVVVFG